MRPHPVITGAIILTLITGVLLAMSFLAQEDGTGIHKRRAILVLIITGIMTIFLLILATSKLWFPHLWKRNSTHARHRQHTRHHPTNRDRAHPGKR